MITSSPSPSISTRTSPQHNAASGGQYSRAYSSRSNSSSPATSFARSFPQAAASASASASSRTGSPAARFTTRPSPRIARPTTVDAGTQYSPPGGGSSSGRDGGGGGGSRSSSSMRAGKRKDRASSPGGHGQVPAEPEEPKIKPLSPGQQRRPPAGPAAGPSAAAAAAAFPPSPGPSTLSTTTTSTFTIPPSSSARSSSSETSSTSNKRSRPTNPAKKIMPAKYEDCDVKDLVQLISAMLMELIRFNDSIPLRDGRLTRFHSRAPPGISVTDYLQRLATHATLSPPILLSMVYYIDRLCVLYPAFTISSLTVHRFLIASATVASKGLSDSFWTNNTYARVGGVSLKELALLELEFLWRVEWRIVPKPEVLVDYYRSLIERSEGFEIEKTTPTTAAGEGDQQGQEQAQGQAQEGAGVGGEKGDPG